MKIEVISVKGFLLTPENDADTALINYWWDKRFRIDENHGSIGDGLFRMPMTIENLENHDQP